MDWIERLLHLNPDGGSGSLELSIIIGAVIAIGMAMAGAIKVIPIVRSFYRSMTFRKQNEAGAAPDRFDG